MKKLTKLILFVVLIINGKTMVYSSEYENTSVYFYVGGYEGPFSFLETTDEIAKSTYFVEDLPVVLRGYITSAMGGEFFLFEDKTGEVVLEVDAEVWAGQVVTNRTYVELYGDLDVDLRGFKVNVSSIRVINH